VSRGTWDTARVPFDFDYAAITLYDWPFQAIRLSSDNPMSRSRNPPPIIKWVGFRLFPFRSPLLGESLLISLPAGTKMFQFPAFASCAYLFSARYPPIKADGLPHSEIPGSKLP
jgi:hypothetical protein